ncbi:MAG TPA: c-type cytochrome [Steroidobacteraceae bacterium]
MPSLFAAWALAGVCLALGSPSLAAGSAQAGAGKVAACLACHGMNGNSLNGQWPNLAGQNAAYIEEQLQLLRAGKRPNPLMMPMAQQLSDQDIADIAAYYAAQVPAGLEADPSYWQAGEKLYRSGDMKRSIPACMACHGPLGRGNPAAGYPALRAQQSVYVVKQLGDYAAETRYRNASGTVLQSRNSVMMVTIAKRLAPEDIRDVASYLQGMR